MGHFLGPSIVHSHFMAAFQWSEYCFSVLFPLLSFYGDFQPCPTLVVVQHKGLSPCWLAKGGKGKRGRRQTDHKILPSLPPRFPTSHPPPSPPVSGARQEVFSLSPLLRHGPRRPRQPACAAAAAGVEVRRSDFVIVQYSSTTKRHSTKLKMEGWCSILRAAK